VAHTLPERVGEVLGGDEYDTEVLDVSDMLEQGFDVLCGYMEGGEEDIEHEVGAELKVDNRRSSEFITDGGECREVWGNEAVYEIFASAVEGRDQKGFEAFQVD
jgi:hypothetical protein